MGFAKFLGPYRQTDKHVKSRRKIVPRKNGISHYTLIFRPIEIIFFSNLLDFDAESKYELFLAISALPNEVNFLRHLVATES